MSNQHFVDHAFYRIDHQYAMRVQVPRRRSSATIRAKGIFLGAGVVPGLDWEGDYSDGVHLSKEVGERILTDYSKVQCISHPGVFRMLQEGHGAWYEQTRYFLGRKGTVVGQNQAGSVWVEFSGLRKTYSISPAVLTPIFDENDIVLVVNREEKVRRLQYGHGGWQDGMSEILGQNVEVQSTDKNGDVHVRFGKESWIFNPDCLIYPTSLPQWEELAKQQDALKFRRNYSFMTMVDQNSLLKVKHKETRLQEGDMVHVCDDLETVRSVQLKNGIWAESMKMIVGKVGTILRVLPNDSLSVQVGETVWKLRKELCLQLSESAVQQRNAASNLLQFY